MNDISQNSQDSSHVNILDEFTAGTKEKIEVEREEKKQKQGFFVKVKIMNYILFGGNIVFLGILVLLGVYVAIQKNDTSQEYGFLRPVCKILNPYYQNGQECLSITSLIAQKNAELGDLEASQYGQLKEILPDQMSLTNFMSSKRISFLSDKSSHRIEPTTLLSAFDEMKNNYSSIDKKEIQCTGVSFDEMGKMMLSCDVFSSDWESKIVRFTNGVKTLDTSGGTSIKKASYFIEYLQTDPESPFWVLENTENFSAQEVEGIPGYTKKTTIQLVLQYKTLSFE